MGRRCSRSVGVLTTNCFKLRYEQDRKGRNQGGCLRQPETGLPGPGGHIPTSIHTCPFPGMPGTCLSLASGATHGRRPWYIHTSCFKIPGWMRRRQPHTRGTRATAPLCRICPERWTQAHSTHGQQHGSTQRASKATLAAQ